MDNLGMYGVDPSELKDEELVSYTHLHWNRLRSKDNYIRGKRQELVELFNNNFPTTKAVNYVRPVIIKWATYLMGKPVKFNVRYDGKTTNAQAKDDDLTLKEGESLQDAIERIKDDRKLDEADRQEVEDFAQNVLDATLEREKVALKLFQAAIDAPLTGGAGLKVYWDSTLGRNQITKINPLNCAVEFMRNDSDEPLRVYYGYSMDIVAAREKYKVKDLLAARLPWELNDIAPYGYAGLDVMVFDVEDHNWGLRWTIAGDTVVHKPTKIDVPFYLLVRNGYRQDANGILAQSYVSDMASLNIDICEDLLIYQRMVRNNAYPMWKTRGNIDLRFFIPGENMVIPLGKSADGADIEALSISVNPFPIQEVIKMKLGMLHDIAMMPDAAFGNFNASITSSVAMNTQLSPTLSIAESLKLQWDRPLRELARRIVLNCAKHGDPKLYDALKDIDPKCLDVTLRWPNQTPEDDVVHQNNEIGRFKAGFQSFFTTMENLGIEDPAAEVRRMAREIPDPLTNPVLRMQLQQLYLRITGKKLEGDLNALQSQGAQSAAAPAPGGPPPIEGQIVPSGPAPQEEQGQSTEPEQAAAEDDAQMLLAGQEVEVSEEMDHTVRISVYTAALSKAKDPDIRALIQRTINQHQQLLKGASATPPGIPAGIAAAMQAAGVPQPGAPGGELPPQA